MGGGSVSNILFQQHFAGGPMMASGVGMIFQWVTYPPSTLWIRAWKIYLFLLQIIYKVTDMQLLFKLNRQPQ